MSGKNSVVETVEVTEIITKILDKEDINVYITEGTEEIKILLDDGAVNLLKAHYKSKSMWGNRLNG